MARRHRRHHRRGHRSNPLGIPSFSSIEADVKEAAAMAGGLVAVNIAAGLIAGMLPLALTTGFVRHLTKGGIAIGVGAIASAALGGSVGKNVTLGALSGVVVDVINDVASGTMLASSGGPANLSGLGSYVAYDSPSQLEHYTGMGHYTGYSSGLGTYGQFV